MRKQFVIKLLSIVLLGALNKPCIGSHTIEAPHRKSTFMIADLFLHRWSPRAMSGEALSDQELMSLFEAAHWAPSSYNSQPWRFIYAKRNTPHWELFFDLLVDFNKEWARNAGALIVVVSKNTFDHNGAVSRTHSFDTGAAWQNLALQGSLMGLVVHGMGGFDYERAKELLRVPEGYTVEAMIAIGRPGSIKQIPQAIRDHEHPSDRNSLHTMVFEGTFHEHTCTH